MVLSYIELINGFEKIDFETPNEPEDVINKFEIRENKLISEELTTVEFKQAINGYHYFTVTITNEDKDIAYNNAIELAKKAVKDCKELDKG